MTDQSNTVRQILLTQGQSALVDAADYDEINAFKWFAQFSPNTGTFYAARTIVIDGVQRVVLMHRQIMGLTYKDHQQVDHRDNGQTLDNRRTNLRVTDHAHNQRNKRLQRNNKCGFKGVCFDPTSAGSKPWRAMIRLNGKQTHLGRFWTPEETHAAYRVAALANYGEYARFK